MAIAEGVETSHLFLPLIALQSAGSLFWAIERLIYNCCHFLVTLIFNN